jgi:hypothetical protein
MPSPSRQGLRGGRYNLVGGFVVAQCHPLTGQVKLVDSESTQVGGSFRRGDSKRLKDSWDKPVRQQKVVTYLIDVAGSQCR